MNNSNLITLLLLPPPKKLRILQMNTLSRSKLFSIIFLFHLLSTISTLSLKGLLLNCGSETLVQVNNNNLVYNPDYTYLDLPTNISVSKSSSKSGLLPLLSSLRSFPIDTNKLPRKFCYAIPTVRDTRYLVRTTYYYFDDDDRTPPVFDQIVDGTFWTVVNTTSDYNNGRASIYEAVFLARGKFMSVCVAANSYTLSDPFINALELVILHDSVYNSTDFKTNALGLIARNSFGYTGPILSYPDDEFNRYWQPFMAKGSRAMTRTDNITTTDGFWNLPPRNIFNYAITSDHEGNNVVDLQWPPLLLPNSSYYIALYFADSNSWLEDDDTSTSAFDVYVNGLSFCSNLKATASGVSVFSSQWILSGLTNITLTSLSSSRSYPIINAGEIFGIFPVSRTTTTKDVIALNEVKKSIRNPPVHWSGDPCLPRGYSWSGVTCSEGSQIRVIALNLSGLGLNGGLSPYIANMTALTDLSFANNKLSGHIPDLGKLRNLKKLHLQDNQLTGAIPRSLENIKNLKELFLENNNMTGKVPLKLLRKPGLTLRLSPGNNFLQS